MKARTISVTIIRSIAAVLILVGLTDIYRYDHSIPLLVGLFTFFVTGDRMPDERAAAIKSSSAYIALVISYTISLLSTNLYSHHLISYQITEINHFLIMLFAMAIIIYHTRMYLTAK